jgi:hypothetical protein
VILQISMLVLRVSVSGMSKLMQKESSEEGQ